MEWVLLSGVSRAGVPGNPMRRKAEGSARWGSSGSTRIVRARWKGVMMRGCGLCLVAKHARYAHMQTPATCSNIAIHHLYPGEIDLVISGPNCECVSGPRSKLGTAEGPPLGRDTYGRCQAWRRELRRSVTSHVLGRSDGQWTPICNEDTVLMPGPSERGQAGSSGVPDGRRSFRSAVLFRMSIVRESEGTTRPTPPHTTPTTPRPPR